jgi:predicted transcriptional regulator
MRRGRLEVIKNILEVIHQQKCSKTRVVYQANLNFKAANPYLDKLIEKGLISKVERIYSITPRGLEFLREASDFLAVLGSTTTP